MSIIKFTMMNFLKFEHVSKIYKNEIVALDDVTFTAENGEFFFVIGPSGAGKSTLIRLIIRQELPTAGSILFEDIEVTSIPRKLLSLYRQQLGVVFQDLKLIPSKTVRENIEFALEISSKPKNEINETVDYLLEVVGLQDRQKLFPEDLSGGEMQKTAIARALANDPKLFIADEPTGNLDPDTSFEILDLLKTINTWGTTVMVVSHAKDLVDSMQTRVILMDKGKIISDKKGGYERPNSKKPLSIKVTDDEDTVIENEKDQDERSGDIKEKITTKKEKGPEKDKRKPDKKDNKGNKNKNDKSKVKKGKFKWLPF